MKNFKYAVGEKEYVMSPDEHMQITDVIKRGGQGHAILRGGRLVINVALIRSVNETDHLTEMEETVRDSRLRLQEASLTDRSVESMARKHFIIYEKMGWEHKKNCICILDRYSSPSSSMS